MPPLFCFSFGTSTYDQPVHNLHQVVVHSVSTCVVAECCLESPVSGQIPPPPQMPVSILWGTAYDTKYYKDLSVLPASSLYFLSHAVPHSGSLQLLQTSGEEAHVKLFSLLTPKLTLSLSFTHSHTPYTPTPKLLPQKQISLYSSGQYWSYHYQC